MQGIRKLFVAVLATAVLLGMGSLAFAGPDGNADIMWRNSGNGIPVVWYLNGATYLTYSAVSQPFSSLATTWQINGLADFNKDGNVDILWRQRTGGNGLPVAWLMNNRTYVTWNTVSTPWTSVASNFGLYGAGDFNRDGNQDILWRNLGNGIPFVWYLNGMTYVTYQTVSQPYSSIATTWLINGVADFNKDGNQDILWRQPSGNGLPVVWFMNNYTYVTWQTVSSFTRVASTFTINGVADINKDGNQDIIWRNTSNGVPVIWYMNGQTYVTYGSLTQPFTTVSTTFTQDGAADFGAY